MANCTMRKVRARSHWLMANSAKSGLSHMLPLCPYCIFTFFVWLLNVQASSINLQYQINFFGCLIDRERMMLHRVNLQLLIKYNPILHRVEMPNLVPHCLGKIWGKKKKAQGHVRHYLQVPGKLWLIYNAQNSQSIST